MPCGEQIWREQGSRTVPYLTKIQKRKAEMSVSNKEWYRVRLALISTWSYKWEEGHEPIVKSTCHFTLLRFYVWDLYVVEGAEIIAVAFFGEFRKSWKIFKIFNKYSICHAIAGNDCLSFFPYIYKFVCYHEKTQTYFSYSVLCGSSE